MATLKKTRGPQIEMLNEANGKRNRNVTKDDVASRGLESAGTFAVILALILAVILEVIAPKTQWSAGEQCSN